MRMNTCLELQTHWIQMAAVHVQYKEFSGVKQFMGPRSNSQSPKLGWCLMCHMKIVALMDLDLGTNGFEETGALEAQHHHD